MNTKGQHDLKRVGDDEGLIPKFGGYRNTKSWQIAELIYDVTVRFCDKFVDPKSRTHDQMEQAARSGTRNLSEGSVDSSTSKKIEIKLTGIALGSLDELSRDYASFLKHHGLPEWTPDHPALSRFKALRCATFDQFRAWVSDETRRDKNTGKNTGKNTDKHGQTRTEDGDNLFVRVSPCRSVSPPCRSVSSPLPPPRFQRVLSTKGFRPLAQNEMLPATLAANGALSLLNLCMYFIKRQMQAQADAFEKEGGFTERLYRKRTQHRDRNRNISHE